MFITKTLALPHLDETDHLKIVRINETDVHTDLLDTLCEIGKQDDFDLADDELLAHLCVRRGLFSYRDWQARINSRMQEILHIDYEVDPRKKRLNLEETVYLSGGLSGRISGGGYKMLCALCARDLVFDHLDAFTSAFGQEPRPFIESVWRELDELLQKGILEGTYTDELWDVKYHFQK